MVPMDKLIASPHARYCFFIQFLPVVHFFRLDTNCSVAIEETKKQGCKDFTSHSCCHFRTTNKLLPHFHLVYCYYFDYNGMA